MPSTLLLADDSVTIQRVIELTFADEDIEVVTVSDGDQAIVELSRTPRPDIVLADVGMPGRTGYDVAQYIRDEPSLAHIPVLLLTGAFEPVDQERASAVGCSGVLAKPFEPQLVVTRVRELLAGRSGHGDSPGAGYESSALPAPSEAGPTPVAEYFDRLDEAFASFSGDVGSQPQTPAGSDSGGGQLASDSSPSYWSPPDDTAAQTTGPADAPAVLAPAEPLPSSEQPAVPPLADAFTALLAAEQTVPPSGAPVWPVTDSASTVSDEVVERVTRRVLEQLTDRVIQDVAAEIISEVAERLVRAEIDRIKSAIE